MNENNKNKVNDYEEVDYCTDYKCLQDPFGDCSGCDGCPDIDDCAICDGEE